MTSPSNASSPETDVPSVEFYWRPGCPFCMSLERSLKGAGIPLDKRNIWDDPAAAAFVRSVAGGNETVPTVRIGATSMVNPSPKQVAVAIMEEFPSLSDEAATLQQPSAIGKLLQRMING